MAPESPQEAAGGDPTYNRDPQGRFASQTPAPPLRGSDYLSPPPAAPKTAAQVSREFGDFLANMPRGYGAWQTFNS
jgi:hypothetical protein